ncbi:MAG: class I SAM-dependent methyltransferase [Chloroflexota bacterium]
MNNAQTFSQASDQYAKHRPQYPDELFSYLSEIAAEHGSAWDCATGNGQAAVSCAKYFAHVEATDLSAEQIEHGILHPKVRYSVSPAEHTSFADHSFDLITVATAVHWFDQEQFFREVDRVLKPQGILAIWSYGFFTIETEIDALIDHELLKPIDPFWADGNRQIFNGYRDLALPFDEIHETPKFFMQVEWTLGQLSAYLRTWSAVKRFTLELGVDPVTKIQSKLKAIWREPDTSKAVTMPLYLRVSMKR